MGSLVNSVKPMAHTHSSFYQLIIHTHKKKKISTETLVTLPNLTKHMYSSRSANHRFTQRGYIHHQGWCFHRS